MKKFLSNLFASSRPPPAESAPPTRDSPATIEDGSENATRRQLVQVLLRDVLRRSGIPPGWIECQMLLVSSRTRGHGMYVRLVIKHWDDRLLHYTFALQNALLTEIGRFETQAPTWLHGLSWQLEVEGSCPYTELPDKAFWLEPASQKAAPPVSPLTPSAPATGDAHVAPKKAAVPENNAAQDLERLFAIRDQELGRQAAEGLMPVGYEKTQPSPLK